MITLIIDLYTYPILFIIIETLIYNRIYSILIKLYNQFGIKKMKLKLVFALN